MVLSDTKVWDDTIVQWIRLASSGLIANYGAEGGVPENEADDISQIAELCRLALRFLCSAHYERRRWVGGVVGCGGRFRCDDREGAAIGSPRILPL